jgi:hypothetical protein
MGAGPLVTEFEPAEVSEPTQGAFDHVPRFAQTTPVPTRWTGRGQERFNPQPAYHRRQGLGAIGRVPLQHLGFGPRGATGSGQGGHPDQQGQRHILIAAVRRRRLDQQRQTLGFGQHMAFTAGLGPIRRIGTGVRPPKSARTLALSSTARCRFSAPALPNNASRSACSLGQTSSWVQRAKRRQQVLPLPHCISAGKACNGMPVRSTKTMPVKAWRGETRGRPPWGEGLGSGGRSGSICSHSSSGTSLAMSRPSSWDVITLIL